MTIAINTTASERATIDVLMVTHNRPDYTRWSLTRLLETSDEAMRVWVWHNGTHVPTLDVVRSMEAHPRLHRLHHSPENRLIREPINWLFTESDGALMSLVNDDCLVSEGWADALRDVHADVLEVGVVACWHFQPVDFQPELAERKLRTFPGGHRLMVNPWVQGSGVMVKRACVEHVGPLLDQERGFTPWCIRAAAAGWTHGWPVPLIPIDHMDDPRSPNTLLRTDADLVDHAPLSARLRGTDTIESWLAHLQRSARIVQEAPSDPRLYVGWRKKVRRTWTRLRRKPLLY